MGSKEAIPGIIEYRVPGVEENETTGDKWKSHKAVVYLDGIAMISKNELPKETVKIDHYAIAAPVSLPKMFQSAIPEGIGTVEDSYCDWQLLSYKITLKKTYVIRNPYGEICAYGVKKDKIFKTFSEIKQKLQKAPNLLK